jgi:predicted transcriptional regulator
MKTQTMKAVTVRVPENIRSQMKILAAKTGIRLEALYAEALTEYLATRKKAA